jgi:SAM-dependent methyltransferase
MDINKLLEMINKADIWPAAFEKGDLMWDDDYISRHMLSAHLDESNNRATYKKELRKEIVKNIISTSALVKGEKLLDLGCGPGIYAQEFASYGVDYTGIDISRQSLGYAMNHKGEYRNTIHFIHGDYTSSNIFNEKYDCATMIWCDFGALSPDIRDNMLRNVYSSLNQGGYFCFDVFATKSHVDETKNNWRVEKDGFWQEGQYIVLERNKYYETVNSALHMAIVASEKGVKAYRIWDKRYTEAELRKVLNNIGFEVFDISRGGLSKKQYDMFGVYCRVL